MGHEGSNATCKQVERDFNRVLHGQAEGTVSATYESPPAAAGGKLDLFDNVG